jgi:hypothetical protein
MSGAISEVVPEQCPYPVRVVDGSILLELAD